MARIIPRAIIAIMPIVVSTATLAQDLEVIVVTAQRRSENLHDVPISVSAVSADQLSGSGVQGVMDLPAAVPGLTTSQSSLATQIYIRGVGTTGGSAGQENSVATYVDGVYLPAQAGVNLGFNNIERVEVLKGPQGTLFGRNATGGVVNIITRTPSHEAKFEAEVGYGNHETLLGHMYATSGFGEKIAADLALSYEDQKDGFGRNIFTGQHANRHKDYAGRSKILLDLSDATRITLQGDYSQVEADVAYRSYAPNSTQFFTGQVGWPHGFWDNESDVPDLTNRIKNWGLALQLDQNLGWSDLKSISAYRAVSYDAVFDIDLSSLPLFSAQLYERDWQFTQEVNISSNSDSKVKWIGGLYYLQGPARFTPWQINGQLFALSGFTDMRIYSEQFTRSYAAYGQATFPLAESTNLTLGVRYSKDKRELSASGILTLVDGSEVPAVPVQQRSATFNKPTWRIALQHDFTADLMAYVSYSRGFHSGVYNLSGNVVTAPVVKPETLDAYEIGFKSTVGRRLRLDGSVFYYDYKNLQLTTISDATQVVLNAAEARMYGLDLNVEASVSDGLSFRGGVGILQGEYTDYPDAPISSVNTTFPFGDTFVSGSAKGNSLIKAPKYNFSLTAEYDVPIAQGDLRTTLTYVYTDKFYWEPDNRLVQGEYGLLNGQAKWTTADKGYHVRVFANNLMNKLYFNQATSGATGDIGMAAPGRTYGLAVGVSF